MPVASGGADARRALLERLIDYAGLFPPARLPMTDAVAEYAGARAGPEGWLIHRFICPASRLDELVGELSEHGGGADPWPLSVVLDRASQSWAEGIQRDLEAVAAVGDVSGGRASVEVVEIALPPPVPSAGDGRRPTAELTRFLDRLREAVSAAPVAAFLEIPQEADLASALDAVAEVRAGAKLRCGGPTPEAVPSPERVAAFIAGCVSRTLPFKATAGLHHPFRHRDPATGAVQHGFLNLLAATALAASGLPEEALAEVVADDDPSHFALTAEGLTWRDRKVSGDAVARARREGFRAYGSCSFREPVADLMALGVLGPAGTVRA